MRSFDVKIGEKRKITLMEEKTMGGKLRKEEEQEEIQMSERELSFKWGEREIRVL